MRRFSARPPVEKIFLRSIGYGAGQGLLAGVVPAVLAAIIVFLLNQPPTWVLLAALGGAAGGAVRGWQPGRELSDVVTFSIGWRRLLQAAGALTGAALGALLSLPLIWAILPILAGVVVGGMLGFSAGRKTWELGLRIGWERISVGLTTVFSGVWGASIVRWLALTPTGSQTNQWAIALTAWVTSQTASPLLASAAAGLLAGALGGAIGGFLVDLSARIFRLTE